jgi:hypothetical protein
MRNCSFFLLLIYTNGAYSQGVHSLQFNKNISVGAYSKHFSDPYSFTQNQASLHQVKDPSLALFHERKFMVKELNHLSAAFCLPTQVGGLGLTIDYFGTKTFNESGFGVAYGKKLSDIISMGMQLNYYVNHITGYEKYSSINASLAMKLYLTDQLQGGFQISVSNKEKLPNVYRTGLGYDLSPQFFMSAEVYKEVGQSADLNISAQYAFMKDFLLRAGLSTTLGTSFLSIGLSWKTSSGNLALSYHPQLGFTPSLLIVFRFIRKTAGE